METTGFRDLVLRAQAGDRSAVDRLFEAFQPQIERWARAYAEPGRADESTSDLMQKARLRAWQKLGQVVVATDDAGTWAKFSGWLKKVVRTTGKNSRRDGHRRRRRPQRPSVSLQRPGGDDRNHALDVCGKEPSPSANLRACEQACLVRAAVDALPDPKDREIVRLRFFEGLSLHQVAAHLALTYDQVRERYRACKDHLGQALLD